MIPHNINQFMKVPRYSIQLSVLMRQIGFPMDFSICTLNSLNFSNALYNDLIFNRKIHDILDFKLMIVNTYRIPVYVVILSGPHVPKWRISKISLTLVHGFFESGF